MTMTIPRLWLIGVVLGLTAACLPACLSVPPDFPAEPPGLHTELRRYRLDRAVLEPLVPEARTKIVGSFMDRLNQDGFEVHDAQLTQVRREQWIGVGANDQHHDINMSVEKDIPGLRGANGRVQARLHGILTVTLRSGLPHAYVEFKLQGHDERVPGSQYEAAEETPPPAEFFKQSVEQIHAAIMETIPGNPQPISFGEGRCGMGIVP